MRYGGEHGTRDSAPSVPGRPDVLFTAPPIDLHYMSEAEVQDPYRRVNNPPTRGMFTWVKSFQNYIGQGKQDTDLTGVLQNRPQERTSHMRVTPPAHGFGYGDQWFDPRQLPQQENTYKFNPVLGTDRYGTGVLNADTFGAGQTAGGQGGSNYTPAPGPPQTSNKAGTGNPSGMPVWG
jgi:hypothetical protein